MNHIMQYAYRLTAIKQTWEWSKGWQPLSFFGIAGFIFSEWSVTHIYQAIMSFDKISVTRGAFY